MEFPETVHNANLCPLTRAHRQPHVLLYIECLAEVGTIASARERKRPARHTRNRIVGSRIDQAPTSMPAAAPHGKPTDPRTQCKTPTSPYPQPLPPLSVSPLRLSPRDDPGGAAEAGCGDIATSVAFFLNLWSSSTGIYYCTSP